jgi:predicted Fe-S protein YdhL (DUF1289 family)
MDSQVKSPCLGICSTTYGDIVCKGCKRNIKEIYSWGAFSNKEKIKIWQDLDEVLSPLVAKYFNITDKNKMLKHMQSKGILNYDGVSGCFNLWILIKKDRKININEAHQYGFELKDGYKTADLENIFYVKIDEVFYKDICKNKETPK